MSEVFSEILTVDAPQTVTCGRDGTNPAFQVTFTADGGIPFPQVIVHARDGQKLFKGADIQVERTAGGDAHKFTVTIPAGRLRPGEATIQVEGCRRADIERAGGDDWIKAFRQVRILAGAGSAPSPGTGSTDRAVRARPAFRPGTFDATPRIYFGIHKHMHQPYYNTTDPVYWDGEKEEIFASRGGPYTHFIPTAVRQYVEGGLPHAGLSTSWSGSLVEQLNRCAAEGLCGGRFAGWAQDLRGVAREQTALGHPRVDFTAFGFFHPLMALIPGRNIVKQIAWHRAIVRETFGVEASNVLFPPETAFHVRMIPALNEAGVEAVIYDSIHRFRTCREYPYGGIGEGMLPPNAADQVNRPAADWLQLHNIWAGSKIAPSLLRPEYAAYEDPGGGVHKIIAVPAERYIGNEDARGGFGALQYPDVLGQVHDSIVASGSFDPRHPPFFLLHSDGDNHGGGAESYYAHNTGALVRWLQEDPRFQLITIQDYLALFPPDPEHTVHIEPGSWSGADNGDPQFMKWFSRYHDPYSPDLNSWAVLTALQNMVHTVEDARPRDPALVEADRLMLTAETSCYWYWTGQQVWDQQVTNAANTAHGRIKGTLDAIMAAGADRTPPTVFAPWVTPENPGGKKWGQGCLEDAPREASVHTFVHDAAGLKRVELILRTQAGESRLPMRDHGPYPSQTGALVTSNYYTAELPAGAGDIRYYVEAEDAGGNVARSALERIWLA